MSAKDFVQVPNAWIIALLVLFLGWCASSAGQINTLLQADAAQARINENQAQVNANTDKRLAALQANQQRILEQTAAISATTQATREDVKRIEGKLDQK